MQNMRTSFMCLFFLCLFSMLRAQDTTTLTNNALRFADSLMKASYVEDWNTYSALTNYSAIKYYGGPESFKEHAKMVYYRIERKEDEKREKLRMVQLMNDGTDQWQCVIEKERNTYVDSRKVKLIAYIIGQSMDNGENWKFVDIAHNSTENIIFIMPALFSKIAVPPGKMLYEDEMLAAQQQQAAPAPKPKTKTNTTGKKK